MPLSEEIGSKFLIPLDYRSLPPSARANTHTEFYRTESPVIYIIVGEQCTVCRAVEIRICPLLFQINFENRAFFNSNASSFEPSYSSTKISSRAIRRVSRPFHHVCRTIIIQLLGKRQIFHSIWNWLNTKGNTPGLFNTGDEIKIQNSTAMDTISPCDAYVWGRAYRIMNQRCPATDVSRYSSVCLSVQILRPVALPIFSEQARRGTRRANKLRPDKLEPAPLPPPRGHVHRGYIYIYI